MSSPVRSGKEPSIQSHPAESAGKQESVSTLPPSMVNGAAVTGIAAAQPAGRILYSWKEIALYLGRGVRTLQRYERDLQLPIRRPAGKDRSAVMAFTEEIDSWLNRAPKRNSGKVRTVLALLETISQRGVSGRKLALVAHHFNVLSAFDMEEMFATAEKYDVDGFVLECNPGDEAAAETCESLKERFPKKPLFAVIPFASTNGDAPKNADFVITGSEPERLVTAVEAVFGDQSAA